MRVMIVAPVQTGAGETITALHIGRELEAAGHGLLFLASPFARELLAGTFGDRIMPLAREGEANEEAWARAVREFRPDLILFADYPLLFFPEGCVPMGTDKEWPKTLLNVEARIATLDHFGWLGRSDDLFVGPPHLVMQSFALPETPAGMEVLLPCPMHGPDPVPGRSGTPFRYWEVPLARPEVAVREVRERYLIRPDDLLIFHPIPTWAWKFARTAALPYYDFLPEIYETWFSGLDRPVTVISVNSGELLRAPEGGTIRFLNLGTLPSAEFEALLLGADLVLSENRLSISLGKAACGLRPCGHLRNSLRLTQLARVARGRIRDIVLEMESRRPGAIYPFEAFPNLLPRDVEEIGLFRENRLTQAMWSFEVFGGEETGVALRESLLDPRRREELRQRQREYVDALGALPAAGAVLARLLNESRGVK